MLTAALERYGKVYHVHTRFPPEKLQYITHEQFNGVEVPPELLKNYYVIYIYKNPVKAILSRFTGKPGLNRRHLNHVGCDPTVRVGAIIEQSKDLYQLQQFYDNYTKPFHRNYDVYCIKYETIFDRQPEISKIFNIGPLNLVRMESNHSVLESKHAKLYAIYDDLIQQMDKNDFIFVQKGTPPLLLSKLSFS